MRDDDLDLELDDEPVRAERQPVAPRPAPAPAPAAVATKPEPRPEPATERRGWLRGVGDSVERVRGFRWTWRTFLVLLVALIILVIFVENWVPLRFYALGFAFEIPRTVAFVIDLAIGAGLMWLWLRRSAPRAEEAP